MVRNRWRSQPTLGVLAGWQFYRTATNLSYLKPIFSGICQAARDLDFNLLLGCGMGASAGHEDPIRPAWPDASPDVDYIPISPRNTDGLLVFNPLHSTSRSAYIQEVLASGHPILFIGSGESGPTIAADNAGGIFSAVDHLTAHGHRRIAFIAGSQDDLSGDSGERLNAYIQAINHHNLESDPHLIAYGRHFYHGGYLAIQEILARDVSFTAVVASNDESALGAMRALEEAGRNIPEDVAIIGFDNRIESSSESTSLSSIHVPLYNIGYRAAELMYQHVSGKQLLSGTFRVDTRLVVRTSCGCPLTKRIPGRIESGQKSGLRNAEDTVSILANRMVPTILNQVQNLSEPECQSLCQRIAKSFMGSFDRQSPEVFLESLGDVLAATVACDDDVHIWQAAITLLGESLPTYFHAEDPITDRLHTLLDQARVMISQQMQQQHRQYVGTQQWTTSRLSLLTAALQTALEEPRIYEILAQHLPAMRIPMALVILFEPDGDDPYRWSILRDGALREQPPLRFPTTEFPPEDLFSQEKGVRLTLIPLVDQSGQSGYVVFNTDYFDVYGAIVQQLAGAFNTARLYRQATEGRRLAEEANRMKSRFLSTISHELRTPLNLIVGLSGILLKGDEGGDTPLSEPIRKDIDRIHAYSQHLGGLIGDVIDLTTSDAGQLRLNNEVLDLSAALRMVAESGAQMAADKGLAWEAQLPESGPWVWGDPTRLRQVFLNLINNAIKFTTIGSVRLILEDHGGQAVVIVSDTGLGISKEDQIAIFDEFVQSERSIALGYGGLGLGLAISKRLVDMHGGT
ncbi:MAG TPA: substrate-binding domain-containing protein [Anaerolineaceae bacterium]|nr:substrate-binding domain-containing protein [Anaerolineaceae bacterium]